MSGSCPKGCRRRWFEAGREGLVLRHPLAPARRVSQKLRTPQHLAADYQQMLTVVTGLPRRPALEVHDTLGGVGGMFVPSQNVILLDWQELDAIAARLRIDHAEEVRRFTRPAWPWTWVSQTAIESHVFTAVMRRVLAHELGHALIVAGYPHPFGGDEEAGADFYAGRIAAILGYDERFGALVFHELGCTGASCTHPRPGVRARAFVIGYREQRAA